MPVRHVRIDERLIHGQVTVRWTREVGADLILVANDEVAADEMQKMLLPLSAPSGVKTEIVTVEEAAESLKNGEASRRRTFLIVKRPADVIRLLDSGVQIEEINVGNMSHREGSKQVKRSVSVTPEDVEAFRELDRRGVRMTARMMPEEGFKSFMEYLPEVAG
ncbi:MAG: PTS sugar transporter subunit IIB [Rubrobacteraceae bacterium]|nr:PTS sugar transporter subunit IIB [Rubrobacteraceae bacterium]MCL6439749.1 PTS sugar transporter subunit IIB [Rubrobacteraceae bacterium]